MPDKPRGTCMTETMRPHRKGDDCVNWKMSEKQASSEIAPFTWNDHAEEFLMEHYPNIRGNWRFLVPILGAFAEKVERDTRELCAQKVIEALEDAIANQERLPGTDFEVGVERGLNKAIKIAVERIRGKE